MSKLTSSPAWTALQNHYASIGKTHLRDLFANDPARFDSFSVTFEDILLDYSKNRLTSETLKLLCDLARQAKVEAWRDRMYSG